MLIERRYGPDQTFFIFSVGPLQEGERLDLFLKSHLGRQSREMIKRKIALGEVTIEGRPLPRRPATRLHSGEIVTMLIAKDRKSSEWELEHWHGEHLPIEAEPTILYDDNNLIVISKPPFMTVHPTGKHFFNCVTVYFEHRYQHTMHTIHRLDRETSGIMLVGKNPSTANELALAFKRRRVKKCYLLFARKNSSSSANANMSPLPTFPFWANERMRTHDPLRKVFMVAFPVDSTDGKPALTYFELLAENQDYLLALAYPFTGRQHQIRLHAAHHGFPLVGDKIYNGDHEIFIRYKDGETTDEDYRILEIPRHALHAYALSFPYMGEQKIVVDHVPSDLKVAIESRMPELDMDLLPQMMEKKVKDFFTDKSTPTSNVGSNAIESEDELEEEED